MRKIYITCSGLLRIYPNSKQKAFFYQNFGANRFIYNQLKECFDKRYRSNSKLKFPSTYAIEKMITPLKQEYTWLQEADSHALMVTVENFSRAHWNYAKHKTQNVNYKSRKYYKQTYTTKSSNNAIYITDKHHLRLPKIGNIYCHNAISYTNLQIKRATVTWRQDVDKFWIAITGNKEKPKNLPKTGKAVGVDLGLGNEWLVTSDGERWQVPKTKDLSKRMSRLQSKLDRRLNLAKRKVLQYNNKHKLSKINICNFKNWQKTCKTKSKLAIHIANIRKQCVYDAVNYLVKHYDTIVIENLKVSNMMKNHKLAKAIANANWHKFRQVLQYKCQWYGRQLIIINPKYTSRICSKCGKYNPAFEHMKTYQWLATRKWQCPYCNAMHDRDINAAKNILHIGLLNNNRQGDCLGK